MTTSIRSLLVISLSLPVATLAQSPQLDARIRELDAYAAKAVSDWRAPGLAVAVVKDGRIVFAKGYGVRELGRAAAVDTQTMFGIASTTKAMTAMALAMLVDEGKVRWDDPVTRHLPDFQLADPYVTREITIRDLLTHRAGLPGADFLWSGTGLSGDEIIRRMRLVPPAYSLRSSFIYQNVMYAVAGRVIQAASGMSWADFLRTRIFVPLGMTHTVASTAEALRVRNVASPHFIIDDTVRVISTSPADPIAPAGAVWSSVADMAKWMQFLLDSGRVAGRPLVQVQTFAELVHPQTMVPTPEFYPTVALTKPHWQTYGLGWYQQDYLGRKLDFHTGSIDGLVAIVGLLLDEQVGICVLSNLDHMEARHALMLKAVDLFTGAPPRDWNTELLKLYGDLRASATAARNAADRRRTVGTRPSLPLDRYAGTYSDSLYGTATIVAANGGLRLTFGTLGATLEHWQYDTFRARWDHRWQSTSLVTFTIGPDGRPSVVDVDGTALRRDGGHASTSPSG